MNILNKQANCAFSDNDMGCFRIMTEKICSHRKCTFYITREKYEKGLKTDYLLQSFQKGVIDEERYWYLKHCYYGKQYKT